MKRLSRVMGDVFWSSMIVIGLLIVGFFVLRMIASLGKGTIISRGATSIATAATPAG